MSKRKHAADCGCDDCIMGPDRARYEKAMAEARIIEGQGVVSFINSDGSINAEVLHAWGKARDAAAQRLHDVVVEDLLDDEATRIRALLARPIRKRARTA